MNAHNDISVGHLPSKPTDKLHGLRFA